MKQTTTVVRLADRLSLIVVAVLVLLPFHAFLTVWLSSVFGHYTGLRLWKELLLAILVAGAIYMVAIDVNLRNQLFKFKTAKLVAVYAVLVLALGVGSYASNTVSIKSLAYGLLLDLRFLIFFLAVWIIAGRSKILAKNWQIYLLLPAVAVIIFGLLQWLLLPYDFLKHFGYSATTIFPYETVNHNINYPRIMSSLRGANPLGAYLVLILGAITAIIIKTKNKRTVLGALGLGACLALILSFSRSAWIGALICLGLIIYTYVKNKKIKRFFWIFLAAGAVILALLAIGLRHNTTFEDAILHTDHRSQALKSSNQGHATAFKEGVRDIVHQPLGRGPGTAGPASVYNNHPSRISENYFLQIGQEVGVVGMALFVAINVMIGQLLWQKKDDPLAMVLLASLVGLTFVNMLSHAWTDDTIAYIFWGLTGIVLAPDILKANKRKLNEKNHPQKP